MAEAGWSLRKDRGEIFPTAAGLAAAKVLEHEDDDMQVVAAVTSCRPSACVALWERGKALKPRGCGTGASCAGCAFEL